MNFSEKKLLRKDRKSSVLVCGEAGERKQILARFPKCSPQMTGQITFKLDFKFPTFPVTQYSDARGPAAQR